MLLSMRRTEEPDKKRVKIEEEDYYRDLQQQQQQQIQQLSGWKERKPQGDVDESILERLSECSVTSDNNKNEKETQKPSKKRSFVRQFGVREENEYVDITQVQQLLLDSATTSGKSASSKNRTSESQFKECQQQFTQEQLTSRSLSFSESNKAPIRTVLRPHSQPSCSSLDYYKPQGGYFPYYQQAGRQIEYFGKNQPQPQRMLAEGLPTPPHLQPPTPSTGGHSPNVEELFALWFGTPSGNAGSFFFVFFNSPTTDFFFITYPLITKEQ